MDDALDYAQLRASPSVSVLRSMNTVLCLPTFGGSDGARTHGRASRARYPRARSPTGRVCRCRSYAHARHLPRR
jgi:hypothetical protein